MPCRNLYIHVPFCAGKCDYCAFYSLGDSTPELWKKWLSEIRRRLENFLENTPGGPTPFRTVYFGGGTPTFPDADFLEQMFSTVSGMIETEPGAEITSEANPESITGRKAEILARYVNRVSMGIQSFHPEKRAILGRKPATAEKIPEALKLLRGAGLKNIGFDLIYAVPGETVKSWMNDLERALELSPVHLSCYSLTPESGTPYAAKRGLAAADDSLSAEMWLSAGEILGAYGLPRYEISNYARRGFEARHNVNVWHGDTYLGLGPAASSFNGIDRATQSPDMKRFLDGEPPEVDRIDRPRRVREILVMGLRTVRGWRESEFFEAAGTDLKSCAGAELDRLRAEGFIETDNGFCRPTERGLLFWDELAERLILV